MKKIIENYRIQAAGTIWDFESVEMESDVDGKTLLRASEIERINRSIANALCSEPSPLTPDELEFLAKITRARNIEIAASVLIQLEMEEIVEIFQEAEVALLRILSHENRTAA